MDGVELHFHALPGLDDGPRTLADSVELLRLAANDATATVVATPHVRSDFVTDVSDFPDRVRELSEAAGAAGIAVRLRPGAELGHDMVGRLTQGELESVAHGPPGARWLLLETPFEGMGDDFHAAADELRDRGFQVLIAHPERSADATLYGAEGLRRELAAGALAQVNAQSITGEHGKDAQRAAFDLIGEGLVAAVSSDAHGDTRPPLLGEAGARLIAGGVDADLARGLVRSGPQRLLARGIAGRKRLARPAAQRSAAGIALVA
jgi:protein-tyrosine phosphatase